MLLEDIYKEFLFDLEIKNYSIRTIKGYRNNNQAFFSKAMDDAKLADEIIKLQFWIIHYEKMGYRFALPC
ncbi:hypothetical protein P9265_02835 [Schinkia azotoformans]|uniref:hypothetical protein n=1 Tax=Schinkia azotoformans TaxID=1454 RepID=UPI002E248EF8|nr:hypothetical protein [Schinkia azotoformans]